MNAFFVQRIILFISILFGFMQASDDGYLCTDCRNRKKGFLETSMEYIKYVGTMAKDIITEKKEEIEKSVKQKLAYAVVFVSKYMGIAKEKFYSGVEKVGNTVGSIQEWAEDTVQAQEL